MEIIKRNAKTQHPHIPSPTFTVPPSLWFIMPLSLSFGLQSQRPVTSSSLVIRYKDSLILPMKSYYSRDSQQE